MKDPYRILIIDDDLAVREALRGYLEDRGYLVEAASDGPSGLEIIKAKGFDVIVLDIKMPGMNGLEVLRILKQWDPETMVIIMTGYASLETAIQAIREGAYDYITKPFRLEEISITIKNACEKVFLRRQQRMFIEELRRAYEGMQRTRVPTEGQDIKGETPKDVVSDILRLSELFQRGLLTQEEFHILKKQYLKEGQS